MTIIVTQPVKTFLDAINRVFQIAGIIRGDTDAVSSFSDLQHGASINLAIIAIQDTLTDLTAFYDFPMERNSASITLVNGTRLYNLASDFVQFWQSDQFFYDAVGGNQIREYPGGERQLSRDIFKYQSDTGSPNWWYYSEGSASYEGLITAVKQVGFYQLPDSSFDQRVLTYDYEGDIIPTLATDPMPFIRSVESNSFCQLAAVRFQSLYNSNPKQPSAPVETNPQYINSRSTLLSLINPKKPNKFYGPIYSG